MVGAARRRRRRTRARRGRWSSREEWKKQLQQQPWSEVAPVGVNTAAQVTFGVGRRWQPVRGRLEQRRRELAGLIPVAAVVARGRRQHRRGRRRRRRRLPAAAGGAWSHELAAEREKKLRRCEGATQGCRRARLRCAAVVEVRLPAEEAELRAGGQGGGRAVLRPSASAREDGQED